MFDTAKHFLVICWLKVIYLSRNISESIFGVTFITKQKKLVVISLKESFATIKE